MDSNKNHAFSEKLKEQVSRSFDRVRKALDLREKLLLRQLSVVVQQSHHVTFQFDNIKFVDSGEEELIGRIRTYGKYNIDNFNIILKEPYENEDYIQPVDDHDLMHKSCRRGAGDGERENPESEEIVVEFFNNKSLIREGAEMVRESIINLALNESKEIIDKSFNEGAELQVEDELERMKIDLTNFRNRERTVPDSFSTQGEGNKASVDISNNNNNCGRNLGEGAGPDSVRLLTARQQMITKASQTELDKAGRHSSSVESGSETDRSLVLKNNQHVEKNLKNVSNLTMNNCGGTINLKNVTNLTINACKEGGSPEKSRSPEPNPARSHCPSEEGSPECGFYKRLITENKILRQHILKTSLANASAYVPKPQSTATSTSLSDSPKTELSPTPDSSASSMASEQRPQRLPLTVAELRAVLNLPQQDDTLTQVLGDLFALASPTAAMTVVAAAAATAVAGGSASSKETTPAAPTAAQEHTMQIQQWLKQIISETETEPLQNAEIMEFSNINN